MEIQIDDSTLKVHPPPLISLSWLMIRVCAHQPSNPANPAFLDAVTLCLALEPPVMPVTTYVFMRAPSLMFYKSWWIGWPMSGSPERLR